MAYTGKTYAEAAAYVDKAKDKAAGRPVGKNGRLFRVSEHVIALRLHSTNVVVYHSDGDTDIFLGGWNTHTTRSYINAHSPARVHTTSHIPYLSEVIGHTPAKVQKCRTCHGLGMREHVQSRYKRDLDGPPSHWYQGSKRHPPKRGDCSRCKGEGRADYGSKPIYHSIPVDGEAVRVDATGVLVATVEPVIDSPGITFIPKPSSLYGSAGSYEKDLWLPSALPGPKENARVLDGLKSVLPDLNRVVKHPVNGEIHSLTFQVVDLNDNHKWSRERIADWLDTLDLDLTFPVPSNIRED